MLARPVDATPLEVRVPIPPVSARANHRSRRLPVDRWLSLGPASRLVGVDPDTLRRWANEGRVDVFLTPGRHRRFDRRALERLASPGRAEMPSLASLGASPERLTRVYRRSYARDDPARRSPTQATTDREGNRQDGRRLVAALIAHLDTDRRDEAARRETEAEAVALVDAFARRLRAGGLSLTEGIALFMTGRRPFLAELARLGRRRTLDSARLDELYADATALLDRLLLRLVDTYQAEAG